MLATHQNLYDELSEKPEEIVDKIIRRIKYTLGAMGLQGRSLTFEQCL